MIERLHRRAFDVMMIGLMLFCAAFVIDGEPMGFVTTFLGMVGLLGGAAWLVLTMRKMADQDSS